MRIEQPGVDSFTQLSDVPQSYVGSANLHLIVNPAETGVIFSGSGGGGGTVTQVSVTTANGVSGVVATDTTTPAITLTLGAITPSSIVASGNISGLNLSGTNTGNQTSIVGITGTLAEFNAALTGADFATGGGTVTGTSTGSNSGDQTSIVGITGTKAQFDTAVTDGNFLYVGDVTQYTDEMAQDAVGAMVDGTLIYTDLTPLLSRAALTGAITATAGSNATALGSFTTAQLNTALSDNDIATGGGTATGSNTGDNAVNTLYSGLVSNATHTGDATGATALTVVRLNGTSLAGLATGLLKNTTGTGVPSIAVNSDLPAMSATVGGAVPTPPNNTTTFLRGDGTFATPTASATITTQEEGVSLSTVVTTLNFTGAGVTASGAGATTTINIPGGSGSFAITETEVDFGTTPITDKTFTVTNVSITALSKIMVTESGSTGTSRVASGDSLWDTISYSCVAAAGSFTLYARASGAVVGFRKLYYTYS